MQSTRWRSKEDTFEAFNRNVKKLKPAYQRGEVREEDIDRKPLRVKRASLAA